MMYEIDAGGRLPTSQLTVEQFTQRLVTRARFAYQARVLRLARPKIPAYALSRLK